MTDDAAYEISNIVNNVNFNDLHHNLRYVIYHSKNWFDFLFNNLLTIQVFEKLRSF